MSYVNAAITASNAFNAFHQGKLGREQAEMQAMRLDYQAKLDRDAAMKTAEVIRRAGRKQVGAANAAYAGSGVVVGQGSAAEVEREITQDYEHDAFQALLEGDRSARGREVDARMARISGRATETAGMVNAFSTALAGGYQALKANGWRTAGPGFSGTQAKAPIVDRSIYSGT